MMATMTVFLLAVMAAQDFTPTDDYAVRKIEGWTVLVNPRLDAEPELRDQTLRILGDQLYLVARRLPPDKTRVLRTVKIWVERREVSPPCMCYHSIGTPWLKNNGRNPDKNGGVELGNAENFNRWTLAQPWMLLHELAHAYHDRLPDRFKNSRVKAAYDAAMKEKIYTRVLRRTGRMQRHYATNNPMEYFAEATEAFFGANDYYPFNRAELREHDPRGYTMVKRAWGISNRDNYIWKNDKLPGTTPWNLTELAKVPEFEWVDTKSPVRSLLYRGEPFQGKPTSVFALYATPGTLKGDPASDAALPAVVLVHGGGGTAFREWVELWAGRGYAAIAMDLAGRGADRKRLPDGGPDQKNADKFGRIDAPVTEQWSYHAVANVIRAHSLIRSFPEIYEGRTAITGISWGGYLTCIVAGLDRRFQAAVPVYGCGFLTGGSAWDSTFAKMSKKQRARWVELWDPSRYLRTSSMPVFFINGTNDGAYWLPAYRKTYELKDRRDRNLRITVKMPHGHKQGSWRRRLPQRFNHWPTVLWSGR